MFRQNEIQSSHRIKVIRRRKTQILISLWIALVFCAREGHIAPPGNDGKQTGNKMLPTKNVNETTDDRRPRTTLFKHLLPKSK